MSEKPGWEAWGKDWAHYVSGGRVGTQFDPSGGNTPTAAPLVVVDEVQPQQLQEQHIEPVVKAPTAEEAEDRTAVMGTVIASTNLGIDLDTMVPGGLDAIEGMTRVERKKLFKAMVTEMVQSTDPATKNMGLMFGLLSKDAMDVKLSDHVKDTLEAFAKGAGKVIAAATAAVGVAIAAASKKIGELWDKTKPAREKIASAFKSMVETIARVTKPAREKAKEIAKKAGIAMQDAAHYVGEKANALKKAFLATALGKAISRATEKAGIKIRYGMMGASAAIGAGTQKIAEKLARAGASMQADHKKAEEAASKIQGLAMSKGEKFEKLGAKVKARLAAAQEEAKKREEAMTPEERAARKEAAQTKLEAKKAGGKGK